MTYPPSRRALLATALAALASPAFGGGFQILEQSASTLGVAHAILSAASLSFIGLGIQPPYPEWGAMLSSARGYLRDYAYMSIFPGLAIMITILSLNFIGDGLRDAMDPKLKR